MSHQIADRPLAIPKQFDDRHPLRFSEGLQGRGCAHAIEYSITGI
jgi:hypothetical protein